MGFSVPLLQRQVQKALKSLKGIAETVTYNSLQGASSDRSSTTDDMTEDENGVTVEDVIFTEYSSREIDGETIRRTDRKVLVPALNLGETIPKPDDTIARENDEEWTVKNVSRDPAGALYVLQVRQ